METLLPTPGSGGPLPRGSAGLRRATAQTHAMADLPRDGLPDGVGRWHLLAALRGAAQALGLTGPMLALVTHYVDLTWDQDWEAGAEPVIPIPLTEIAEALGRSERQIRNLETRLAGAGFLVWRDSGNHHRKGRRCRRTGALLWAYGPSLAPLRARASEILAAAACARDGRAEARRLRLAIGAVRRQIRADLAALGPAGTALATGFATLPERCPAGMSRTALSDRLAVLRAVQIETARHLRGEDQCSGKAEIFGRHISDTAQDNSMNGDSNKTNHGAPDTPEEKSQRSKETAGLDRISLDLARRAAGPALAALLPRGGGGWVDLVEAAHALLPLVAVPQSLWAEACAVIGRRGAALCILIVERGLTREGPAAITSPGGYFRALIDRARDGRLHLVPALHGLAGG